MLTGRSRVKQDQQENGGGWGSLGIQNDCEIVGFPFFFNEEYQETLFFFVSFQTPLLSLFWVRRSNFKLCCLTCKFLLNAHWRALWKRAERLLAPRRLPDGPTLKSFVFERGVTRPPRGQWARQVGGLTGGCAGFRGVWGVCWAPHCAGGRCEAARIVRKCEVSCRLGRIHPVAGAAPCWHRVVSGEAVFFFW